MTTSESKGRFFTKRIDWHNELNRIDSNRELECSNGNHDICTELDSHSFLWIGLAYLRMELKSSWYVETGRKVHGCNKHRLKISRVHD